MKKAILLTVACLSLAACSTYPHYSNSNHQASIVKACTDTANHYPYSRDRLLYKEYGELFTEDAEFYIEGRNKVVGRQAIVNALKERGPKSITRHISNVVDMKVLDNGKVQGISYLVVWTVDADTYSQGDIGVSSPSIIGEYHDQFVMKNGRCLIKSRIVKIVYTQK